MTSLLQELVGRQVTVYSVAGNGSASDTGVLEAFDDQWIRISRNGDSLYFPIHHIRLVKPVQ